MSKLNSILDNYYVQIRSWERGDSDFTGDDEAKQDIKELMLELIGEPSRIYDGDDSLGKEYQAGYNNMAEAARILILELRQKVSEL